MPAPSFTVNGIFPAYLGIDTGFNPEEIPENIAYVLDGAGWKLFKRNGVSIALIPVKEVSGVTVLTSHITFTAMKLPLDLIRQVTAWFRAVYVKHRSEAVGYLYYQPTTGEWDFIVPTQTVGAAHASYEGAPKRPNWLCAGTIHSHGSMSAFHSGTDDADENFFDGVHITVGKLDSVPEYSCSLVVQGVREKMEPHDVVDGMAPVDQVPVQWLSAIKLPKPTGIFGSFLQTAVSLWERYYAGELSESAYKAEIGKIETASKEAEEANRISAGQVQYPAYHRDVDNDYQTQGVFSSEAVKNSKRGGKKHGNY